MSTNQCPGTNVHEPQLRLTLRLRVHGLGLKTSGLGFNNCSVTFGLGLDVREMTLEYRG
jgi:hypothetical protein